MTSPTLDELIGEDPGVAHACREIEREEERLETMRHLGQAIWDMIAAKHGTDFADQFANVLRSLDRMTTEFRS